MAATRGEGEAATYSEKLEEAEKASEYVKMLYGMGRWVGVPAMILATAAVLGGYAKQLGIWEMVAVLTLLFLLMATFYAADAFARLLTAPLPPLSQQPSHLLVDPHKFDPHRLHTTRLRRFSSSVTYHLSAFTFLIAFLLLLPVYPYLFTLPVPHPNALNNSNRLSLPLELLILSVLCIAHAFLFALATLSSSSAASRFSSHPDHSLVRFYHHLLAEAFRHPTTILSFCPHTPDASYFYRFAYKDLLGGDCRRNMQPRIIASLYRDLLRHLYEAERQRRRFVWDLLNDSDTAVQQAAANLVGLWISEDFGLGITDAGTHVTTKGMVEALLDKVGGGQVGWAATNSLTAMFRNPNARSRLQQLNLEKTVGDKLVKTINPTSRRSLVVVRAIVYFVHFRVAGLDADQNPSGQGEDAVLRTMFRTAEIIEKLKTDLETLMTSNEIHRVRVLAAYTRKKCHGPI